MYLKRLEMNGFKSFAQHTEMVFEEGITAIVGPNGSGKSNITDAVRWVLGEQNTRLLRGSCREDIIFNGTQKRRPMQFCEVTLTFDNHDAKLPIDFTEVSVTRRLYRSGESEYLLNRTQCRLKDIVDLFRDTGIGKEGYSVIGQGRIDDIVSARSENRRQVFEEAAGIVKYRVRKEEAARKLGSTIQNLQRLDDLLEELGTQLVPLEEQSQKAREYIRLCDELKKLELALFVRQYENNEQKLQLGAADMAALDEQIQSANEKARQLETAAQHTREDISAADTKMAVLQQRRMEISERIARLEGDERVLGERMESLKRENARILSELAADDEKADALRRDIGLQQLDSGKQAEAFAKICAAHEAKENELKALEARIASDQERLEERKTGLMDALNSLVDVRSRTARLSQVKAGLEERLSQLREERDAAARESAALEKEHKESQDALTGLIHQLQDKQKLIAAGERETDRLREDAMRAEQKLRDIERSIHEKETRKSMLEDMAREYEGYSLGVRMILKRAAEDAWLKKGVYGVLGDLILVPEGFETAMEAAMGAALGHIVTVTDQDAKELIQFLRANKYGRATFYPVSTVRERMLSEKERALLNVPGCLGVASELLEYDAHFQGVVRAVLGRTVVMETLDQAILLARKAGHTFKIVTRAGDIISPGGAMSGGSRKENDTGLFMRKRVQQELDTEIHALRKQRKEYAEALSDAQAALKNARSLLQAGKEEVHAMQVQLAQVKERHEIVEETMQENARRIEQLREEDERIGESMTDVLAQMEGSDTLQGDIESSQASIREEIAVLKTALDALTDTREKMHEALTKERIRIAALKRDQSVAFDEQKRLQKELEQITLQCDKKRRALEDGKRELERVESRLAEGRARTQADRKCLEDINEQIKQEEDGRIKLLQMQQEQDRMREQRREENTALHEKRHKLEMQLAKTEYENRALQERVWEDYEITYASAKEYKLETGVREAMNQVSVIKTSIRLMGPVNVSAVEDYRLARERYDYLSAQQEDMHQARGDLERLIADLEKNMRRRFTEQFALINENFQNTFVELFGGGSAQLRLADAGDVLESDIDIIAQPPGKKLQSISLLSGGEKALTAIAILFAMLKLKPSPFCILDEIESTLDDVNVVRFAKYLKNYSELTQFILITHRKDSMEQSDVLYGITMEEKGVSKMVSVCLSA
ncbi:MAG: chromosome segregation protein SMC [Bacillota bacterium]